jgi:hypothetical protein
MREAHSIRIPVHGFVTYSDWERDIINHPVVQRLRRIRQLAFSEHLYPGSVHTRFEHSLGVMHIATLLYDALAERYAEFLEDRFNVERGSPRTRRLVRLAALLHDVGHAPFSHTSEMLMPENMVHEDYTAQLIRHELRDVIEDHPENKHNLGIKADEVASFYRGDPSYGSELLFWKELVTGQLDADRMDYLLRDSLHCGVDYGNFDLHRIIDTVVLVEDNRAESAGGIRIGIDEGGMHAAEGLILSRYFMFTQVYFHPVRKAYDYHAGECVRHVLRQQGEDSESATLPDPSLPEGRRAFLRFDDSEIMGSIKNLNGNAHAEAILNHRHDRCVWSTPEVPAKSEIDSLNNTKALLESKGISNWQGDADKEWYKIGPTEILIGESNSKQKIPSVSIPLSSKSDVVAKIPESRKRMLFVSVDRTVEANAIIHESGNKHA